MLAEAPWGGGTVKVEEVGGRAMPVGTPESQQLTAQAEPTCAQLVGGARACARSDTAAAKQVGIRQLAARARLLAALRSGHVALIEQACESAEIEGVDDAAVEQGRAEACWLRACQR